MRFSVWLENRDMIAKGFKRMAAIKYGPHAGKPGWYHPETRQVVPDEEVEPEAPEEFVSDPGRRADIKEFYDKKKRMYCQVLRYEVKELKYRGNDGSVRGVSRYGKPMKSHTLHVVYEDGSLGEIKTSNASLVQNFLDVVKPGRHGFFCNSDDSTVISLDVATDRAMYQSNEKSIGPDKTMQHIKLTEFPESTLVNRDLKRVDFACRSCGKKKEILVIVDGEIKGFMPVERRKSYAGMGKPDVVNEILNDYSFAPQEERFFTKKKYYLSGEISSKINHALQNCVPYEGCS